MCGCRCGDDNPVDARRDQFSRAVDGFRAELGGNGRGDRRTFVGDDQSVDTGQGAQCGCVERADSAEADYAEDNAHCECPNE